MSYEIKNKQRMEWGEQNEKRYKWIYNKLSKEMPNFNYDLKDYILKMNKTTFLNFIKKLQIGYGSREAMLFTVSKYLGLHDSKNPNIDKFVREGKKLMLKTKQADGENLIDEDKVDSYESYEYFLSILKKKDYKTITGIR